jgi:hypothetical protein
MVCFVPQVPMSGAAVYGFLKLKDDAFLATMKTKEEINANGWGVIVPLHSQTRSEQQLCLVAVGQQLWRFALLFVAGWIIESVDCDQARMKSVRSVWSGHWLPLPLVYPPNGPRLEPDRPRLLETGGGCHIHQMQLFMP